MDLIKTMILPFYGPAVFIARNVRGNLSIVSGGMRGAAKPHSRKKTGGTMKKTILALSALMTLATVACGKNPQVQADINSPNFSLDDSQYIVGGEAVSTDEQISKSTVALSHPMYGVFCTGTLVAKNLVLTAGHCLGVTRDPRQISVIFNVTPEKATAAETRKVLGGKTTDAWPKLTPNQEKNWGDITLLRFDGTIPAGYAPAVILGNPKLLTDGMDVTLAGYGLTSMAPQIDPGKLMKVALKVTDSKYSETEILFAQQDGKGACHGDSGGPAYAIVKGRVNLVGVTSRSATLAGGASCLEGSVYTSVPAQKEFLIAAAKFLNSKEFRPGQAIPQPGN